MIEFAVDFDSDNEPLKIDYANDMDDEFQESKSHDNNDDSVDEDSRQIDNELKPQKSPPKRKQWQTKKKNKEYQKLFSENKHYFDMSCDGCSIVFESLDEARVHYSSEHSNSRGYLKCCGRRLFYRCQVVQHVARHLDPDKFKYVNVCEQLCIAQLATNNDDDF